VSADGTSAIAADVFASGTYWQEYYSCLGQENAVVGAFLSETTRTLARPTGLRILDAGCGPTALYWTLFVPGDNEVHGFDGHEANLRTAWRQIHGVQADEYSADAGLIEAATSALARLDLDLTPMEHIETKAWQVRTLQCADLTDLWPYEDDSFDLVQSCFALECLADAEAMQAALRQAHRVLRWDGTLVLANVARANRWICGGQDFAAQYLDASILNRSLAKAGFKIITQRDVISQDAEHRDQGYGGILVTAARPV
jgi:SAM-dependent methyltransferase